MHRLWQDVRYGSRMLVKFPVVTLVALLSLAFGIATGGFHFVANVGHVRGVSHRRFVGTLGVRWRGVVGP